MPRYPYIEAADRERIQGEKPWEERLVARTIYERLRQTVDAHSARPAFSFQITSGPQDKAETLTWREFHDKAVQAANLFRSLGVGENDVVAYLLPNSNETVLALLGGMTAGR